ncbi:HAD-IIIA family hydrolase [Brucella sp. 2716]|uniref:HAD-IIIA family hydrolase n=1 Tax=Brucella sp. 2716 TaxID=2975052 RepID=UPI00217E6400|nr:HAD-IIIA family hydrolase [Brucella sp. 2716]UWF59412.1 HAD-IIIA family hydrolase [Brucella sp. 2716]
MTNSLDVRQAVILAGGAGTRLASRLNGLPKPLVDVDGTPLLGRQLKQLANAGFDEVIILVNYRAEAIESYVCDNAPLGLKVYVVQDGEKARGTAGAIFAACHLLAETFLVVYGDTLFDVDLARFYAAHNEARMRGGKATLFLHPNDHPHDSDIVAVGTDGFVTAFYPKPHPEGVWLHNLVNAAMYIIDKQLIDAISIPDGIVDFGKDLFPMAIAAGHKLAGYRSYEYIKDLGTPDRLDKVVCDLRSGKIVRARITSPQKAIFLDRDGTLNKLNGYISSPDQLQLLDGVGEAVHAFNEAEYRCVMVTNQPVVARGECSEEMLENIHAKLETLLGEQHAYLDATYVCPHHPDAGFPGERRELKFDCKCRKPNPGMIKQAASDLSIDLSTSWMIGDTAADIGAAKSVGIKNILIKNTEGPAPYQGDDPDFVFPDLNSAAHFIIYQYDSCRLQLAPLVSSCRIGTLVRIAGDDILGTLSMACLFRQILAEYGKIGKQFFRDLRKEDVRITQPDIVSSDPSEELTVTQSEWLNSSSLIWREAKATPFQGAAPTIRENEQIPYYDILVTDHSGFFDVSSGVGADVLVYVTSARADGNVGSNGLCMQRPNTSATADCSKMAMQLARKADLVINLPSEHSTK